MLLIVKDCMDVSSGSWTTRVQIYSRRSMVMLHPLHFSMAKDILERWIYLYCRVERPGACGLAGASSPRAFDFATFASGKVGVEVGQS